MRTALELAVFTCCLLRWAHTFEGRVPQLSDRLALEDAQADLDDCDNHHERTDAPQRPISLLRIRSLNAEQKSNDAILCEDDGRETNKDAVPDPLE